MNTKIKKLRSKKGMTLVELLVGVTIVVIVFAATLGAMSGGFSTTVGNANQNKVDAINQSVNEVIMDMVKVIGFEDSTEVNDCISEIKKYQAGTGASNTEARKNAEAIHEAADKLSSGIKYVDSSAFPDASIECQYTFISDKKPTVNSQNVPGIIIKTAMKSASGYVVSQSFVPYGVVQTSP